MIRTFVTIACLATVSSTAIAQTAPRGQLRAGFGMGSDLGEGPEDLRFHIQGEVTPFHGGPVSLGIVLPMQFTGSASKGWGFERDRLVIEFAPSGRVRFNDEGIFRPYADVGFGFAHTVTEIDGWFGTKAESVRTGWLQRNVLGIEFGAPDRHGFFVAVEPLIFNVFGSNDGATLRYAAAVGLGGRF